MNLFWKKLFGSIKSTDKLEGQLQELQAKYKRYQEVAQSNELAEYLKLREVVKTADFKEKKKQLLNRKYKDTEEYRSWTKYQKLERDQKFQQYLKTAASKELTEFLAFQKTPDYMKLADKKAVAENPVLAKMQTYERSAEYRNYMRYKGSFLADEYTKLKEEVNTDDFKKRNAFWSNAKRWETTPEAEQDNRYNQLAKNADIVFYESVTADTFKDLDAYELVMIEGFDWNTLNASRWDFGFHYASDKLKSNHSFANEQQANNGGKNISVVDGVLHLATRREKVTAPAWDVKKGFVEKEFEYTSDVMQTANAFRQKGGVFMAKLRVNGPIHHAFWLGADKMLPHVNIFHYNGRKITVGNAAQNVMDGVTLSGINPSQYYIYSLAWTDKEMVWYVNNYEVYRTSANLPREELYLAFSSFISQNQKAEPGMLEVDWVKVYKAK